MFLNLFANGVTTAETTLFPIGSTRHTVFCVIVSIFFVLQFLRTKRWYQLIMAVAVAFSMIVYIAPENKTLFYTVGIIELILLLAALVVGIVQGRKIAKAEKAAEEAKKAAEEAAAQTAQTAETVQAQAEAVTEAAAEQTETAAETVSEAAEETAQTVTEAVQETAETVTETVTKAAEQTEQTVTEAVQETAETAEEAVKETAEQTASEAENHAE